jgi:hypothetical protein
MRLEFLDDLSAAPFPVAVISESMGFFPVISSPKASSATAAKKRNPVTLKKMNLLRISLSSSVMTFS